MLLMFITCFYNVCNKSDTRFNCLLKNNNGDVKRVRQLEMIYNTYMYMWPLDHTYIKRSFYIEAWYLTPTKQSLN